MEKRLEIIRRVIAGFIFLGWFYILFKWVVIKSVIYNMNSLYVHPLIIISISIAGLSVLLAIKKLL